ncbi:MAG: hypothetical protein GXY24_06795 [Bacteroidales bacterium]|jgi:hypothetical protein|nr:hypothetical protein [Bacteroidales bacterium]
MTEFEQYIRENAARFDTAEPAPGHEERFLARVDPSVIQRPRFSGFRRPLAWAFALAAVAVALAVFRPGASHYFLGVPNNPERVYRSYLAQVEKAYLDFPWEDGYDWESALDELTEENVSLFEQLPEELSPRRQARILKAYYGDLLDGVKQLKNR